MLFATYVDGAPVWIIRRFGEWWLGPALGSLFGDAVLSGWSALYPGPPADWIA